MNTTLTDEVVLKQDVLGRVKTPKARRWCGEITKPKRSQSGGGTGAVDGRDCFAKGLYLSELCGLAGFDPPDGVATGNYRTKPP